MTLDHNDHINPLFSWGVANTTDESVSAKSRAGLEYIIPTTNKERNVTGGSVRIVIEYKNVYVDRLMFRPDTATTKLDKDIMQLFDNRLQEMLKNPHLSRNMVQTISVGIVLKRSHVEDDDGIHSDLLGTSFFMDNDLSRKANVGIPKGTTAAVNHKLMWDPTPIPEYTEENRDRCVGSENRLTVLYNDPDNIFSGLWMNILGTARKLNRTAITNALPGLYITYRSGISNNELVERYYSFEELDAKMLEKLGIFQSKEQAQKGGNTERYLEAEAEIKSTEAKLFGARKEITQLTDRNNNLLKDLNKEETTTLRLTAEIVFLKQDSRLKDREQKIAMETIKGSNKPSGTATFVEICKGASLLTGAVVTAYKVFGTT